MIAIRRDEDIDNIHSIYVDQWDWEKIITKEQRTEETLKDTVKAVYEALRVTEKRMSNSYEYIHCILPEEITFVTSQELEDRFPDLSPREREYKIAKEKGAVFLMQIGGALASGEPHDGRAPDYDDWSLNGDIIVYYPVLDTALELSSMGIRVDEEALIKQLEIAGCPERAQLPFQKAIIEKQLDVYKRQVWRELRSPTGRRGLSGIRSGCPAGESIRRCSSMMTGRHIITGISFFPAVCR